MQECSPVIFRPRVNEFRDGVYQIFECFSIAFTYGLSGLIDCAHHTPSDVHVATATNIFLPLRVSRPDPCGLCNTLRLAFNPLSVLPMV